MFDLCSSWEWSSWSLPMWPKCWSPWENSHSPYCSSTAVHCTLHPCDQSALFCHYFDLFWLFFTKVPGPMGNPYSLRYICANCTLNILFSSFSDLGHFLRFFPCDQSALFGTLFGQFWHIVGSQEGLPLSTWAYCSTVVLCVAQDNCAQGICAHNTVFGLP